MPNSSCTSVCAPGSVRKPVPASTRSPTTRKSPSPSLTCTGSVTALRPGVRQPAQVGRALGAALGVGEPGAERAALDDQAAVGGEDHVRQARLGVDELDLVAELQVGLAQGLPLPDGELAVGAAR